MTAVGCVRDGDGGFDVLLFTTIVVEIYFIPATLMLICCVGYSVYTNRFVNFDSRIYAQDTTKRCTFTHPAAVSLKLIWCVVGFDRMRQVGSFINPAHYESMRRVSSASASGLLQDEDAPRFEIKSLGIHEADEWCFGGEALYKYEVRKSGTSTRWVINAKSWGDIWALGKTLAHLRPDLEVPRLRYRDSLTDSSHEMLRFLQYIAEDGELRRLPPFLEFLEVSRMSFYAPTGPKMKEGYLGKWVSEREQIVTKSVVLLLMCFYVMASIFTYDILKCSSASDGAHTPTRGWKFVMTTFAFVFLFDALNGHVVLLGDLALLFRYRWFKLTPNALVYYQRAEDAIPGEDPRGVIEFTPGMTCELVHMNDGYIMSSMHYLHSIGLLPDCLFGAKSTLEIKTQSRIIRLECPSREAACQWLEAFTEAIYGRELYPVHRNIEDPDSEIRFQIAVPSDGQNKGHEARIQPRPYLYF